MDRVASGEIDFIIIYSAADAAGVAWDGDGDMSTRIIWIPFQKK